MKEPYRFIKRTSRKNIYVAFEHLPGREFSTGTNDMRKAIVFAESMLRQDWHKFDRSNYKMTFDEYARGFFSEADPREFRKKKEAKNKVYEDKFYQSHQARLDNYIIPKFGTYLISSLNRRMIDDWFMGLKARNGKDLSSNTKNKILASLRYVLQSAVDDGIIASDPTEGIEGYTENDTKNRQPFTLEELFAFFPVDYDDSKLVETWGGLMWTVYFLVMRDTGWRPAEVSGLRKENYYPEFGGIYTKSSVVDGVEKGRIKTTNTGKQYKVGVLTERTIRLLTQLISSISSDFLFITSEGNFVQPAAANKHLRLVAKKMDVDLKGRTQYSFRHSFETFMVGNVEIRNLLELMAHTRFRSEYDHRTPEMILNQLSPIKEILNSVYEQKTKEN